VSGEIFSPVWGLVSSGPGFASTSGNGSVFASSDGVVSIFGAVSLSVLPANGLLPILSRMLAMGLSLLRWFILLFLRRRIILGGFLRLF
jgi:hypothetical protein